MGVVGLIVSSLAGLASVACGRTTLLASVAGDREMDGASPAQALDASVARGDASAEGTSDAATADVAPPDAASCTSEGVYLIASTFGQGPYRVQLFSPPTLAVTDVAALDCSALGSYGTINALAVDRSGDLYAVAAESDVVALGGGDPLACEAPGVTFGGYEPFGITFARDEDGADALFGTFVFLERPGGGVFLSPIDVPFEADAGSLRPVDGDANLGLASGLTATGDGRLFGLDPNAETLVEVDVASQSVVTTWAFPGLVVYGFDLPIPLAFWAGDVYAFGSPSYADGGTDYGRTDVLRLRPSDGTMVRVSVLDGQVVGAGVSTCAPLR